MGSLSSSADNPVASPKSFVIERDMDVPADGLKLQLMERGGVNLGDEVVVKLGHDGDEEAVFAGNVVALCPAIVGVEIRALGKMNALLNLRTSATYEDRTAGSIANDLVDQAGLSAGTIHEGPTLPCYAVDSRLSAFAHLKDLADRLGYELYSDRQGKIQFHALGPAVSLDAAGGGLLGSATSLVGGGSEGYAFGKHLLNATANRQNPAWGAIEVGGESPMSGQGETTAHWLTTKDADYRGAAGNGSPNLLVFDSVARTKDLAERFAAGRLAIVNRQAHQIQIRVMGRPQVDLGDSLTTSDVPDALINGNGYVRAIRHQFGELIGFVTDFRISLEVSA